MSYLHLYIYEVALALSAELELRATSPWFMMAECRLR